VGRKTKYCGIATLPREPTNLDPAEEQANKSPGGGEKSKSRSMNADSVQSLTRAIAILRVIAGASEGATLTQVARATGLASSTVHRLLATLQQERFVLFRKDGARWLVGRDAFSVGGAFLAARDFSKVARPFLRRLVEKSGETANLAVLDNGMAMYLEQMEGSPSNSTICKPGGRVELHCSSLGKSILAVMQPEEVLRILAEKGMTRFTNRTIDTPARMAIGLAEVQSVGYAVDDEEHTLGLRCVAAAVLDQHREPIGAISISGPAGRVVRDRLPQLGLLVRSIADELTLEHGGKILAKAV
jgi:IclR family transcriptional regulator, acetate operon repressor